MPSATLLPESVRWLAAALCFFFAFGGILRESVHCSAPLPWYFATSNRSLYGGQARFVGGLYLASGLLTLYNDLLGVVALYATAWLAWLIGKCWSGP